MNKYAKFSSGRITYSCNGAYERYTPRKTRVINIYLIDVILFVSLIIGLLVLVSKFA